MSSNLLGCEEGSGLVVNDTRMKGGVQTEPRNVDAQMNSQNLWSSSWVRKSIVAFSKRKRSHTIRKRWWATPWNHHFLRITPGWNNPHPRTAFRHRATIVAMLPKFRTCQHFCLHQQGTVPFKLKTSEDYTSQLGFCSLNSAKNHTHVETQKAGLDCKSWRHQGKQPTMTWHHWGKKQLFKHWASITPRILDLQNRLLPWWG